MKKLQKILELNQIKGYFGTWKKGLKQLFPREIKNDFNTIGTWVTDNPEAAKHYGKYVYEILIPDKNYLTFSEPIELWEVLGSNIELMKHIGLFDEARFIEKNGFYNQKEHNELRKEIESNIVSPDKERRYLILNKLYEINGKVVNNKKYLEAFRNMLQKAGYSGVLFKNSIIDNIPEKHDVYILFHDEPLKVLKQIF